MNDSGIIAETGNVDSGGDNTSPNAIDKVVGRFIEYIEKREVRRIIAFGYAHNPSQYGCGLTLSRHLLPRLVKRLLELGYKEQDLPVIAESLHKDIPLSQFAKIYNQMDELEKSKSGLMAQPESSEEIDKHKYIESQKRGYDIGKDYAGREWWDIFRMLYLTRFIIKYKYELPNLYENLKRVIAKDMFLGLLVATHDLAIPIYGIMGPRFKDDLAYALAITQRGKDEISRLLEKRGKQVIMPCFGYEHVSLQTLDRTFTEEGGFKSIITAPIGETTQSFSITQDTVAVPEREISFGRQLREQGYPYLFVLLYNVAYRNLNVVQFHEVLPFISELKEIKPGEARLILDEANSKVIFAFNQRADWVEHVREIVFGKS